MTASDGNTAAEWVPTGSVTVRVPGKVNLYAIVFAGDGSEEVAEFGEVFGVDRDPRRHGMAAEANQQAGRALGHEVERVAQVQPGDRAPRPLDQAALARREGEHRPVQFLLDALLLLEKELFQTAKLRRDQLLQISSSLLKQRED